MSLHRFIALIMVVCMLNLLLGCAGQQLPTNLALSGQSFAQDVGDELLEYVEADTTMGEDDKQLRRRRVQAQKNLWAEYLQGVP